MLESLPPPPNCAVTVTGRIELLAFYNLRTIDEIIDADEIDYFQTNPPLVLVSDHTTCWPPRVAPCPIVQ